MNSHIVEGWWKDTGKLEDMLDANRMILTGMTTRVESKQLEDSEIHGHVQLDENVTVKKSVLRGPCIIGAGAEIVDSYVGPFTSVGPQTRILRSEIENSIVLENCSITDIRSRIGGSLIGKNVKITSCDKPPRNYGFMVGDNSEIIVL